MKKLLTLLAILIFVLSSCTHKPVIGLLVDNTEHPRWKKDIAIFTKNVEDLGGITEVRIANFDADVQLDQAQELINMAVDVLVVIPVDQNKAGEIVKQAHKYQIPVISYDRLIKDCNLDYYISTDNIAIGEQQCKYISQIKPHGKYGIIGGGANDNNAYLLRLGQMNILQPLIDKGDIEVVFNELTKSWSIHEGYEIASNYLNTNTDLDAIIAGNDNLASGAITALKEHNLEGKVLVAGMDADVEAIRNIVAGNQTITIYKPIESMAFAAADAAVKISKGIAPSNMNITINNGKRLVPAILLPAKVVNKQNIEMTVISEGFVSEEEISKK